MSVSTDRVLFSNLLGLRKVSIFHSEPRQGLDKLREESLCSDQALREIPRRLRLSRAKSRGLLGMTT